MGGNDKEVENTKNTIFSPLLISSRESYENVAFLYVSNDNAWGKKNIKDLENDLFFPGSDSHDSLEDEGRDLGLLARCDHMIVTRGEFTYWAAHLAGGEFYTEYGSVVPNAVLDKIEEESRSNHDSDGLMNLNFPKLKNKDEDIESSGWLSWLFS